MAILDPATARRSASLYTHSGRERSLPFPTKVDGRGCYSFFFYRAHLLDDEVGAPDSLLSFDVATGKVVETRAVSLSGLGLELPVINSTSPLKPVGKRKGSGISPAEWSRRLDDLFEKEHALAQTYWDGSPAQPQDAPRAADVLDAWPKVTEPGFMPVYLALGASWFAWLGERAKSAP